MYLPYVYIVRNRNDNRFYIGMRSANKVVAEQDLGIKYFTSSKHVKNNFSEYDIEIVAYFIDQLSAFEFENKLIEECWGNPLLMNKHYQKSMSTFSMAGSKRNDLAEYNKKAKSKPKEIREYQCSECSNMFTRKEFCHHPFKEKPFCSQLCAVKNTCKNNIGRKLVIKNPRISSWNKGLSNPQAALNGAKGATKQSETVTGRKRKYAEDGSWTWEYPQK